MNQHEALVSPSEAGRQIDVSEQTIHAWQDLGVIGRVDVDGLRMVPLQDITVAQERQDNNRRTREYATNVAAELGVALCPPAVAGPRAMSERMVQRRQRIRRLSVAKP